MEILSIAAVFLLMALTSSYLANRIPKTGRYPDAKGEVVKATIINSNKTAEKAVTLRAKDTNGRTYKVKIKPTEAKIWIKGDSINVVLDKEGKNYRILFNDYFRENEQRLRQEAFSILEKRVKPWFIAARMVGYTKKTPDEIKSSEADSKTVFTFATLMHLVDVYAVAGIILVLGFLWWYMSYSPSIKVFILPLIVVLVVLWSVYSASEACKNILRKTVHKS